MIWHNSTVEQIAEELNSNINLGLSNDEAHNRLKEFGTNELNKKNKNNFLSYFKRGLFNFGCIALLVIALINYVLSITIDNIGNFEYILIAFFAVLCVLISSLFKYFSDRIINNTSIGTETTVTVIRNGTECIINSKELVPGDIMLIKAGDYIKADGRLLDSYALTCDESMVSGDSAPNEKFHNNLLPDITSLINRRNMVYSGSTVLNGRGTVIVTETGMSTEIGMNKDIKQQLEVNETPISLRLENIRKTYSTISIIASIIVFVIGIIINFTNTEVSFAVTVATNLLFAFCIYFSVGSDLIPSLIIFARAFSISRLKAKGIRFNSKVVSEELKDISVICTDKTGVLTTEDLTVVKAFSGTEIYNLNDDDKDESVAALLRLALICSNFSKDEHKERHTNNIERSIETACINYAGLSKSDIDGLYPKIAELPFNSDRMLMTTVSAINGRPISITKGAPEIILNRCENIDIDKTQQIASLFAKEGLRVIAVAIKQLDEIPANPNSDELENNLTFVGILGIEDNISSKAARVCIEAAEFGIKTVMVTGDHIDTAVAISKKAGIIENSEQAISGEELSNLSDEELAECINNYSVFARITPEDKLRIVAAFKANNEKVLITGDSVNDAQALIEADFGCALGSTASDLVKDSADIIIEDNHYSSIILAIKESSKIYVNTKKALLHMFSVGLSIILVSILGLAVYGDELIKSSTMILHSLAIFLLPLFSIFFDRAKRYMETTSQGSKFFDSYFILRSFIPSLAVVAMALITYSINITSGNVIACSSAFVTLIFGEISQALCILSTGTFVTKNIWLQKYSILMCLLALVILLLFITTPLSALLSLSQPTAIGWLFGLITFILVIVTNEVIKFLKGFIL